MRTVRNLCLAALLGSCLLQCIRPSLPVVSQGTEIQVPPQVHQILEKDCYSCHSNQNRLAWFDQVVPAYWLVRRDILIARQHLNFSTLGSKPVAAQKASLYEAVNMIRLGEMPLGDYTALHSDAKVTANELATIEEYLAPWRVKPPADVESKKGTEVISPPSDLASVAAEFNGLAFDPGFENWKPISFTDRGDNNTFRFILGNETAVKAARSGQIHPWPDGSRLAKIAWQREAGADGLIHPGKFVQVELMVKEARLYKGTAGWGWGRWRGLDLKPYGGNAEFTGECVGCHMPLRGADYVYTLPMTRAEVSGQEVVNRRAGNLPQTLPWQPLEWNPITLYVNPASQTMAVLLGNAVALQSVRTRETRSGQPPEYAPGTVLALVTWAQREDPHWFGARIPDTPQSVEFVSIPVQRAGFDYRKFEGARLQETMVLSESAQQRAHSILNLAPAALP